MDIEIEKKNGKYGIIYLPTNEIILPFEYDNIMINDESANNFFVVKNGLVGAVHLEGNRQTDNKILADEIFGEREKLAEYISKPVLVCDLPCEYDYFTAPLCGEAIFYNNKENVYLYVSNKNTIIHFEEVFVDNYSVWAKKNNTLYLVSIGEIQYSEPFTKFRFTADQRGSFCSYIDYENYDKLIRIDNEENFKLIKQNQHLVNNPPKVLCFNDKKIEFEYYSENYDLCFNGKPSIMNYNVKLLGIREKDGEHIRITPSFAHTMQYVGKNRFIVCCEDGKFGLCEIKYCGQIETEKGFEKGQSLILCKPQN